LPQASAEDIIEPSFLRCDVPASVNQRESDLLAGRKAYTLEVALQTTTYHNELEWDNATWVSNYTNQTGYAPGGEIAEGANATAEYGDFQLAYGNAEQAWIASRTVLHSKCQTGYYGNANAALGAYESCVKCPAGADCEWTKRCPKWIEQNCPFEKGTPGLTACSRTCPFDKDVSGVQYADYATPDALTGWWQVKGSDTDPLECLQKQRLAPNLAVTSSCNKFVPCEPKFACTGENKCEESYGGERCSTCADGFYKLGGRCELCPDCPLCILLLFLLFITCAGTCGYILTRKKINLAVISIGVDYFQILAIIAQSNLIADNLPAEAKDLFHLMSVFNLNLDLTAPECLSPNFSYQTKWTITELMPLAAMAIFIMVHFAKWGHKKFVLKRTKKLHNHRHLVIGTSLSTFYYLYLYITKTSLAIFNCSATDPPEMDLDGSVIQYLEVEFVPCYEPGGLHMQMLPQAVMAFLVYTVGYPAVVAFILLKNSERVKEDQLLRARETGNSRATNPNCHDFRKRFCKLYYQFKPHHYYWILCILARKFFIATAGLMFRKYPVFLLAFMLLIMFVSYAGQVRHQPYMSMAERALVVAKYDAMLAGQDTHVITQKARAEQTQRKRGKARLKFGERPTAAHAKESADYLMNYNTVEATLLFSACMVLLCGLMFQSKQVTEGSAVQGTLAACVLTIIAVTITYFFSVVGHEVATGLGCGHFLKKGGKAAADEKGDLSKKLAEDEDEDDGTITFSDNAIMKGTQQGNPLTAGDSGASSQELNEALDTIQQLQSEVLELKKKVQAMSLKSFSSSTKKKPGAHHRTGGAGAGKTKKKFGQVGNAEDEHGQLGTPAAEGADGEEI
jgi:hypothetical protein